MKIFPGFHPLRSIAFLLILSLGWPAAETDGPPFLWVIDGDQPSYLFGTIHSPDPRVTRLKPAVREALLESDAVYTEVALDERNLQKMMQATERKGEKSLETILGPELYRKLDRTLQDIDPRVGAEALEGQKIWAITLTIEMLEHQLRYQGQPALDILLWNYAKVQELEKGSLETIAEQVAAFESLTVPEQVTLLEQTLDYHIESLAEGRSPLEELVDVYEAGDLERLGALIQEQVDLEDPVGAKLYRALFTDRNQRMAERIHRKLQDHPDSTFFFAIGAAHFWGEGSVLELLRQKGHKIERAAPIPASAQ